MYEVDFDLHIANLREEVCLAPEQISSARLSRVVVLDGVYHLLLNESMRDRLHLIVDVHAGSAPYIGPGSPFLPSEYANYEPLQEVVLRSYRDGKWFGYVYVIPVLVPNLEWDLVLGSRHFHDLNVDWDDENKRLVPLPPERQLRPRSLNAPPPKTPGMHIPIRRLL